MESGHPARVGALALLKRAGGVGPGKDRLDLANVPAEHRGQALELARGVLGNEYLLDAILDGMLDRPVRHVPKDWRRVLQLGVYDLVFNDRTHPGVIVDATVSLMGQFRKARGLINAVLRRLASSLEFTEGTGSFVRDEYHVQAKNRVVRFPEPWLPDPAVDPVEHDRVRHSLTRTFVETMRRELPLEHQALFESCGRSMPLLLRPRRGVDPAALMEQLMASGASDVRLRDGMIELDSNGSVERLRPVADGDAIVQDLVAAEVAPFVDPQPGERVLDLCAAPGGKTLHMAELMGGTGTLVAAHRGEGSAKVLAENVAQRAPWVTLHPLGSGKGKGKGKGKGEALSEPFDRVLVDVPCSNTGVLMKRVEARYRVEPRHLRSLRDLQLEILGNGSAALRPGGVLVYSTCSIMPEENHELVRTWLGTRPQFQLEEERLRYPHRTGRDGGYMARLRHRG